jgi:glycosyltransferase involved in cell wall biosynthesis
MACGAAVILTDCGGVREYARDGENCLVVPTRDAPGLARAIERVVSDGDLRAHLVRAGRATALQYPVDRFARACADEIERAWKP